MPYTKNKCNMKILFGYHGFVPYSKYEQQEVKDFEDLSSYLESFSVIPRASHKESKDNWFWFNAANLKNPNKHSRTKEDVDFQSPFFCIDVEDKFDKISYSVEDIKSFFPNLNLICHTTTKSTNELCRWRVVIELDRTYDKLEYEAMWRYFNQLLSIDSSTKDCTSRIFFMPAAWEGANNLFHRVYGRKMVVDEILAVAPPAPVVVAPLDVSLTPLSGGLVITDEMVSRGLAKGNNMKLYHILCVCAAHYKRIGTLITPMDMASEASRIAIMVNHSHGSKISEMLRQSEHAITWAETHVETKIPNYKLITWRR